MAPNWKIDADYDYLTGLEAAGWAFEFLRRNPEYIADYETVTATEATLTEQHGPVEDSATAWRQDTRSWVWDPPIKDGETRQDWMRRAALGDAEPKRTLLREWYMAKWGLVDRLPDPGMPADPPPQFNAYDEFPLFPNFEQVGDFFGDADTAWTQRDGTAVVVFDLWRPLKGQIKATTKELKARAKAQASEQAALGVPQLTGHAPGSPAIKFRQQLRMLDAVTAGAKPKQIAAVIFPDQEDTAATAYRPTKRVHDMLQSARSYAQHRYLSIALMDISSE